jgi:hypothetical protein
MVARQKARQIAVLFRFQPQDQVCIAAGTFAIAAQGLRRSRSATLCIQVDSAALHVYCRLKNRAVSGGKNNPARSLRLVKPLPASSPEFSAEDLAWLVEQLSRQAGHRIFDEIEQQNREMLALLSALHTAQAKIERLADKGHTPFAA